MRYVSLTVERFDPEVDQQPRLVAYPVPIAEGDTILHALLHIYEELDSTLAFRHGCRYKRCGTCTVSVNGHPKLACVAKLRNGLVIAPMRNVPVVKDLLVDFAWLPEMVAQHQLYIPEAKELEKILSQPWEQRKLWDCTECLACLDTCPDYRHGDPSQAGPFQFVKVAQLHFDPRDQVDRHAQAARMGVERCADCRRCYCVVGIPLLRTVIEPLLTRT
ncbi:MAG: (2Fe-2S)-binding protein [Chloroflexi bacterium]|nr:(2Fe-2S)-binding protein [Chloroflexota bacterium]